MKKATASRRSKSKFGKRTDETTKEAKGRPRKSRTKKGLDQLDEAIIHCIKQHPDIELKKIPMTLATDGGLSREISYPTLQRRVNKLVTQKVVRRILTVDWPAAGYTFSYRIGIEIDPKELRDTSIEGKQYDSQEGLAKYIMEELPQEEGFKNELVIDDVYILLGGNVDLALDFYAKNKKTATQFIINKLRRLPGISNTVTTQLAYSNRRKWLDKNGTDDEAGWH